jgi:hypothetical protein
MSAESNPRMWKGIAAGAFVFVILPILLYHFLS